MWRNLGRAQALRKQLAPKAPPAPVDQPAPAEPEYHPFLTFDFKGLRLSIPVLVAARGEGASGFPVDRDQNAFQSGFALSPLLPFLFLRTGSAAIAELHGVRLELKDNKPGLRCELQF